MPSPALGRTVLYRLSDHDAEVVNQRRDDFSATAPAAQRTGYIGHFGNPAAEGQVCPATIVRLFHDHSAVNLQVALDGNDIYWATSRTEGDAPGQWAWPEVK